MPVNVPVRVEVLIDGRWTPELFHPGPFADSTAAIAYIQQYGVQCARLVRA